MIVVIVIIGIGSSIAVPNFARMIQRNEWRGFVQTAQNAEATIMSLTGLQYAKTTSGNPSFVTWPPTSAVAADQFITAQSGRTTLSTFRITVANANAPDGNRESAGMQEFYKRTMNRLEPLSWRASDRVVCSVYFLISGSNVNDGATGVTSGYVKYQFAFSEYFMTTSDGRNLAIYHGATIDSSGNPNALADGWHIYQYNGTTYTPYGSL